jgi:hypothetical protein
LTKRNEQPGGQSEEQSKFANNYLWKGIKKASQEDHNKSIMARSRQMSAANRDAGRNERDLPPFPTKQMFVLGMKIDPSGFCATMRLT